MSLDMNLLKCSGENKVLSIILRRLSLACFPVRLTSDSRKACEATKIHEQVKRNNIGHEMTKEMKDKTHT